MLDPKTMEILQRVLDRAHSGHVYATDNAQYGLVEHWRVDLIGDCEDFALWCREELKKYNIESDLVYCKTETGEGHLVCAVHGWVLDNRYKRVYDHTNPYIKYTWISLGRPNGVWYNIEK